MGFSGGLFPNPAYQASKGAVVNLTRALALEVVMRHTPLGRLPEVEDIAAAILFLASPAARCITGVTLPVDSGYLAR